MRLAGALGRFWEVRGHLTEGRRCLAEALSDDEGPRSQEAGHTNVVPPGTPRAKALRWAGFLAHSQGDLGPARALYEESLYDANGQPLATTLADYLLPGATDIPPLRVFHMQTPSPHTAFGIKGMGEGGAIAPPAFPIRAQR